MEIQDALGDELGDDPSNSEVVGIVMVGIGSQGTGPV